jgi:glutamate formiminotransferase / 5-formyltetrahydrofolate cyclo-ligase
MRLVEAVPNVSEGRRPEVVDRIAAAASSVPVAHLLDRTSDTSHNRSVLTLAGEAGAVTEALERMVEAAIADIDMERQTGEHPRIGAVDVVPFVPLEGTTLDECVGLARSFGRRIAERFDLPVYLYAAAATRPERVKLADVRRGEYEGLKAGIGEPGRQPDFGPARMHPTAGATVVGARPFLVAWNVNLVSDDLELAKRIARQVRESSGGLSAVQARGFAIDEPRCVQVSANLLDTDRTPIWRLYEEVRDLAAAEDVDVLETELIGLAPLAALLAVADRAGMAREVPVEERVLAAGRYLRLRDASPLHALELRLRAAQAAAYGAATQATPATAARSDAGP